MSTTEDPFEADSMLFSSAADALFSTFETNGVFDTGEDGSSMNIHPNPPADSCFCDPTPVKETEGEALLNAQPLDSSQDRDELVFPPVNSVFEVPADNETEPSCTNKSPDAGVMRTLSFSSTSCPTHSPDSACNPSSLSSPAHCQSPNARIALPKQPCASSPKSTPSGIATDAPLLADGSHYAPIEESVLTQLRSPLFRMIVSESGNRCISCQLFSLTDHPCYVLTPVEVISPTARKTGKDKRTVVPGKLWLVFLFQRVKEKSLEQTTQAARLLVPLLH